MSSNWHANDGIIDFSAVDVIQKELKALRACYTLVTIHNVPECRMLMSRVFTTVEYCIYDIGQNLWTRASVQFQRGKVPSNWSVVTDNNKATIINLNGFFYLRYAHRANPPQRKRTCLIESKPVSFGQSQTPLSSPRVLQPKPLKKICLVDGLEPA